MVYAYDFHPTSAKQYYVEFAEESVLGTFPTNPALKWVGAINNFVDESKIKTDTKSALGDSAATDRVMSFRNVKFGEEVGFTMDFEPQKTHLQKMLTYPLGGNAAAVTTVDDSLTSLSFAMVDAAPTDWHNPNNAATLISGAVCEEMTLTIPIDNAATIKSKWVGTKRAFSTVTSYLGTGSHAVDVGTDGVSHSEVSKVYLRKSRETPTAWGSTTILTDAIDEIEIKIANKIALPLDFNTATATKIKSAVLLSRKLTLGMNITYADITAGSETDALTIQNINDFTPYDVRMTIDGYVYTFSGVRFPELPYKAGPEDLIGDKITSLPISGIYEGSTWCPPLAIAVSG